MKRWTSTIPALAALALLISVGKPDLDEKSGTYSYKDAEGRRASVPKADIVQIMER